MYSIRMNGRYTTTSYILYLGLHESRDGTIAGTRRITGSRFRYTFLIDFTIRLHGAGTFFIPSRQAGIPVMPTGILAKGLLT